MLKFNGDWRFEAPGAISAGVKDNFIELIGRIASQVSSRQEIFEHFKYYFASSYGVTAYYSTSESWAESDLYDYMTRAGENAPLFIEAFHDACEQLRQDDRGLSIPSIDRINRILAEHKAGYEIRSPHLVVANPPEVVRAFAGLSVSQHAASIEEQALEIIQESFSKSERLLSEGHDRPAVQEILWLLETVSTAFRGLELESGTIQGKYFNKIVGQLREHHRGSALGQVSGWIASLHGFLSSPTGGGIRHGSDLKEGVALQPGEARLYCNLIRSYINFLLSEYQRMRKID